MSPIHNLQIGVGQKLSIAKYAQALDPQPLKAEGLSGSAQKCEVNCATHACTQECRHGLSELNRTLTVTSPIQHVGKLRPRRENDLVEEYTETGYGLPGLLLPSPSLSPTCPEQEMGVGFNTSG